MGVGRMFIREYRKVISGGAHMPMLQAHAIFGCILCVKSKNAIFVNFHGFMLNLRVGSAIARGESKNLVPANTLWFSSSPNSRGASSPLAPSCRRPWCYVMQLTRVLSSHHAPLTACENPSWVPTLIDRRSLHPAVQTNKTFNYIQAQFGWHVSLSFGLHLLNWCSPSSPSHRKV